MTDINEHINTELLTKFLLGECSKEEQLLVIAWLEADTAHQKELDKLEDIWVKSGELNPTPLSVDVGSAWDQLDQRIEITENKSKRIKLYYRSALLAAASIAIFMLVFNIFKTDPVAFSPIIYSNLTDSVKIDTLPDGSIITLNQNTSLTYLSATNDPHRMMKLEGEAFFDVQRDTLRPFIIKAGMGGIRVLGTSFNVKVSNVNDVTVDVVSGLVELFYPRLQLVDTLRVNLKAGERGILSHEQRSLYSQQASLSSLFWNDKTLIFKNKALNEVFEVLSECYQVDIICDDPNINLTYLSTSFKDKEANEVLDVIAATFDISYAQEGNAYHIFRP